MNYFVYILRCSDDTFYTGITTDVLRRVDEHNGQGEKGSRGAKYTAARRPVKLVYSAKFPDRSSATKEEIRIKKLRRGEKQKILRAIKKHP